MESDGEQGENILEYRKTELTSNPVSVANEPGIPRLCSPLIFSLLVLAFHSHHSRLLSYSFMILAVSRS